MKEFFEDNDGTLSMSRLAVFFMCIVAAIILLTLTYQGKMTEGYLMAALSFVGGLYGVAKISDNAVDKAAVEKGKK